jgi:hypothetical protein
VVLRVHVVDHVRDAALLVDEERDPLGHPEHPPQRPAEAAADRAVGARDGAIGIGEETPRIAAFFASISALWSRRLQACAVQPGVSSIG